MEKLQQLIDEYLQEMSVMQLASVNGDQPWVCNLHYVADTDQNIYWLSKTSRRHSQEIEAHPKVSAAIAVKFPEHPVVGLQIEGDAVAIEDPLQIKKALDLYNQKHSLSQDFYSKVLNDNVNEKLYKLIPRLIVLFDEENFSKSPRQEWKPN